MFAVDRSSRSMMIEIRSSYLRSLLSHAPDFARVDRNGKSGCGRSPAYQVRHDKWDAGITIDRLETAFEDIIAPVIETATAISALKSARQLRSATDCFSTRFF